MMPSKPVSEERYALRGLRFYPELLPISACPRREHQFPSASHSSMACLSGPEIPSKTLPLACEQEVSSCPQQFEGN